jgi:putative transposase
MGKPVNARRVYQARKQAELSVRCLIKKQRLLVPPQERAIEAQQPKAVWTVDFLAERVVDRQKLWFLKVTDEFTRESLAIEVGDHLPPMQVAWGSGHRWRKTERG